eukprot:gene14410-biopygen1920
MRFSGRLPGWLPAGLALAGRLGGPLACRLVGRLSDWGCVHCSIARTLAALDEIDWLCPQAGTLGGPPAWKAGRQAGRPAGRAAGRQAGRRRLAPLSYCWCAKPVTVISRYRIPRYRYLPLPLSPAGAPGDPSLLCLAFP